jgi:hypothetical protein
MAENSTKIILLKLYEFLLRETDFEHPISRIDLAERLREQGVPCHVRTISRDIAALNEFGYEVGSFMRDHERYYYVPERDFSIPELKIMMDAIHAANFVTEKKTEDLTNRIAALGGSHSKALLKRNSKDFNSRKHSNETILYSVDSIEAALQKKKKVSFCYFDLDEKAKRVYRTRENGERKRYIVDPIALVLNDDNYYYRFSDIEKDAALMLYRCLKPLWYTRVEELKKAGKDPDAIRTCLNEAEHALTSPIDFSEYMR